MSFCGNMRLKRTSLSLDAQLTQDLNLNEQARSPMTAGQQPSQSVKITHLYLEQQPTQKINSVLESIVPMAFEQKELEQQPTLPMEVKRQPTQDVSLEQQATLPIAIGQQDMEQQPVPPQRKKLDHRSHTTMRLWSVSFLIFTLLVISLLIGGFAIEGWFSQNNARHGSPTSVEHVNHRQPTPTQPSPIDNAATLFMKAMLRKDWSSMWLMLSPDAQRLWQGEKDFIHFEQAKFGSLQLNSYSNSSAQMQNICLDPETTRVYSNVEVLHISLEASAPQGLLSAPSNVALSKGLFHNMLFALVYYQFNWRILVAGPADLDAPILVPASPPETKLLVPIFMYHHVSNLPTMNYLDYGLTVTTNNFNAQLDWLQQQGYHSITQTELFDALYYGKVLPTHPMMLTFDDGYEDVYTDALPALLAHHYRGVFYIITGMIGGNYMTWNQVRTLAQDGMQVASHTIHHVDIGQPPSWTSTQNELLASKATLETQLNQPVQFFCYPAGEPFHHDPVYEQQIVLADLFKDGYVSATLDPFSFDSVIQNAQTPFQLPRIRISGGESLQLFTSILNSTLNVDAYRMANGFPY
jgi:peptidoglycan/xylan/chitin deacetylase (PgdA/CDA1 family)